MIEALSSLFASVRQASPVVALGVSAATGIGVFAPDAFMELLGLLRFRDDHRAVLGAGFILGCSVLMAHVVVSGGRMLASKVRRRRKAGLKRKLMELRKESLHSLTPDEKAYLALFVLGGENTCYFDLKDGVAGGLVANDVLYISSSHGSLLSGIAHNMQPWAREYLTERPHLLEGMNKSPQGPPRY